MLKHLIALLTLLAALNASLYDDAVMQNREASVLKSLDIDETFLTDKEFQELRENYQLYRSNIFIQILSDAYIYFPLIKKMLSDADLPPSLVYMAMAESSFKNRAYSRARAVGIWQFMPRTATRFGLDVDLYIDERRDPVKSTEAAIEYLNYLHGLFGKWYLAVMAYNCGEGRLSKAIKQAGSDDLNALLSVKKGKRRQYLPKETRKYIRKIIAMASIAQSENLMMSTDNMHLLNRGQSYPMATVEVGSGTTLREISESIGVSYREMRKLNASLNYGFVPPYVDKFEVHIPYEKVADFKENFKRKNPSEKYIVYRVKSGDTLSSIGRKFGINYKVIKDFNNIKGSFLSIKQKLIIPIEKAKEFEYIVQNGDTLSSIARKFNVELERLIDINNKKKMIYAGEKLIIQK